MKASCKNVLPQEGTGCSAVGESLTGPSPVSPTYSGGGNNRQQPSVDAESQNGSSQNIKLQAQIAAETHSMPTGRVTRSRFKRPSTKASDSGESDCSQMSLVSQQSAVSTRTRKRTKTQVGNNQSKETTIEKSNPITVDGTVIEKLVSDNAELRTQITNLSASVEKLLNQYNSGSGQGNNNGSISPTFVEDLTRSIMIQVGNMVNARLEAIESRLLPEKRLRPPLAADLRKSGVSVTQSQEEISEVESMKKGKGKKKQKNKRSVALNPINVMMTDLPPVLSHGPQSSPLEAVTETWATVVRKNNPHKNTQPKVPAAPSTTQKKGRTIVLPKIPTTAAIAITITEGSSATYAETMYKARQRIKLSEFGIESFNQRIGMTGGMLLEISGADCNAKADKLAARMREVLADIDVRITRPCKMGEIIILDVDESISPVDVVTAVAEVGGCSPDDVKVGVIRRQPHSLGRVWVRCPLATNLDMYVISVRVEWTEAINVMLAPNTVIKQMNAQRKHIDALFVRTWDTKLTTEWAPKIVLLLRKKGQKVVL
uniref:SFRICE_011752 n=1 Tax=Spodoptera frugiperda TaxID=7108 RepID=A0A2H1VUA8_SPOFR